MARFICWLKNVLLGLCFLTKSFTLFIQQVFLRGFCLRIAQVHARCLASRKPRAVSMNLRYVVHDTEQIPLRIDFCLAPQGESVKFQG